MNIDPAIHQLLVVDDEEVLREAIAMDFRRRGFTVHEASNAQEAIEIVEKYPIKVVLSDLRMPGGDGLSLLKKIRAREDGRPLFMLISGYADPSDAECIMNGAHLVFPKPFDRKVLLQAIYDAMGIPLAS